MKKFQKYLRLFFLLVCCFCHRACTQSALKHIRQPYPKMNERRCCTPLCIFGSIFHFSVSSLRKPSFVNMNHCFLNQVHRINQYNTQCLCHNSGIYNHKPESIERKKMKHIFCTEENKPLNMISKNKKKIFKFSRANVFLVC